MFMRHPDVGSGPDGAADRRTALPVPSHLDAGDASVTWDPLEVLAGALLLLVSKHQIVDAVRWLIGTPLIENPDGFIANHTRHIAGKQSVHARYFPAVYLLGYGAIKISLVIGLPRDKHWPHPAAVVFLLLFIGYRAHRPNQAPRLLLDALTAVYAVVSVLIIHE